MSPSGVPPLSAPRLLAYGALGLPLAMAALPVYVHVPSLYATASGLSLSLLGGLLLATRLADAFVDPLLGAWSDRAPHRQPLIALALPCLGGGLLALLNPPATGAAPWLVGALLLTCFGFSLASIAYQAWGAELGRNAGERTRLTASREGFGLLGVLLAGALPALLAGAPAQGLARLGWVFPPLLAGLAAVTLLGAPRRASHRPSASSGAGGRGGLAAALADRRFRRLLAVFVANGVAAALPATLFLFFVADVLHAEAWSGAFLALYFVSGVACLPLWVALARAVGRVRAWLAAMLCALLAFALAGGLGAGDVWPFALVCLLSGAALGADLALPAALLADLAEADGRSARAGAYFGWWNLVAKLNLALAAGLALPLLDRLGYRPGGAESGADGGLGAGALVAVYCLLPLCCKTLAALLLWRWRNDLEVAP